MRSCLTVLLLLAACSESAHVVLLKPIGISAEHWKNCEEAVASALGMPWDAMPLSVSRGSAPLRGPLREYMQRTTMREAMGALSDLDRHCLTERLMAACGAHAIMSNAESPLVGNMESQRFQEAMEARAAVSCAGAGMPLFMVQHVIARDMAQRGWAACR